MDVTTWPKTQVEEHGVVKWTEFVTKSFTHAGHIDRNTLFSQSF